VVGALTTSFFEFLALIFFVGLYFHSFPLPHMPISLRCAFFFSLSHAQLTLCALFLLCFGAYLVILRRAPKGSLLDKMARSLEEEQVEEGQRVGTHMQPKIFFEHRLVSKDAVCMDMRFCVCFLSDLTSVQFS
jgi:hypothetical protein